MSDNVPGPMKAKATKSLKKRSLSNPIRNSVKSLKTKSLKKTKARSKDEGEQHILTKWATMLFGDAAINEIKARKLDVRSIWELSTPTTQCNNTIGKATPSTRCWICNQLITMAEGMKAECEHILPIAQAAIYLRLYSPKVRTFTKHDLVAMSLEYGWAHIVCNREKSDMCALINHGVRLEVNIKQIRSLLYKIFYSNRKDSGPLKSTLLEAYGSYEQFVEHCLPIIVDRYQKIVKFLTDNLPASAARLITLAGVSGLSDLKIIRKDLHDILNPSKMNDIIEAERGEIEAAAAIFSRGDAIENMTHMFTLYDDVQDAVVGKLRPITSRAPIKPTYIEYFAARGINPRAPLKSLNPEGFQSNIFSFLIDIYPIFYRIIRNKPAIVDIVSDFICLKLLPSFLPSPFNTHPPRLFIKEIEEAMAILNARLQIKLDDRTAIKVLNDEYEKFIQMSAAETLFSLGVDRTSRFGALSRVVEEEFNAS